MSVEPGPEVLILIAALQAESVAKVASDVADAALGTARIAADAASIRYRDASRSVQKALQQLRQSAVARPNE